MKLRVQVARVVLLLAGCAAGAVFAQQELPLFRDATTIAVDACPIDSARKDAVKRALRERQLTTAEKMLLDEIEKNAKSPELYIAAARVFQLDRNPVNALIAFKKAEKLRPLAPADRFSMALAMIAVGRGPWARPELEKLQTAEPDNPVYPYWLARLDYDLREYDSAVKRLKAVTAAHPGFMRAWDNLALSQEGAGQLDDAVESYRHAVELNRRQPTPSAWPPLNFGTLLTKMDRLEEANDLLFEAVKYDDNLAVAHSRLGANLHKLKRDDEAVVQLQLASKLAPEDPDPLYTLGRIYRLQGKIADAEQVFARYKLLKSKKRGEPAPEQPARP